MIIAQSELHDNLDKTKEGDYMAVMYDELLTVEEVAQVMKCSKNTVYGLLKKGFMDYLVLGRWKVRRRTLEQFLEKYDGYDLSDLDNPKKIGGTAV